MKIIYRISPEGAGYKKDKLNYVNNENCLQNFIKVFGKENVLIMLDEKYCIDNYQSDDKNILDSITRFMNIFDWCVQNNILTHSIVAGSSGKSFRFALNLALTYDDDDEIVYFVENDYIHCPNSRQVLENVFNSNISENLFVSLYQHPDKFLNLSLGGNPFVNGDNGYTTILYKNEDCYWNIVDSTTMTFATKVKTLKKFEHIIREYTSNDYPQDAQMFWKMNKVGGRLITPLPSYATHGETKWLVSHIDWKTIINS